MSSGTPFCDAVDTLANRLVDFNDRATGRVHHAVAKIIKGLTAWGEGYEQQAKKENRTAAIAVRPGAVTVVNAKSTRILNSKECKALIEDFRRSYETCMHSFLDLERRPPPSANRRPTAKRVGPSTSGSGGRLRAFVRLRLHEGRGFTS